MSESTTESIAEALDVTPEAQNSAVSGKKAAKAPQTRDRKVGNDGPIVACGPALGVPTKVYGKVLAP
ncbi:hypothetical protein TgHK011_003745 [Trichoderma gracile]|nr:hypothetical protein TgHK011_003745 [Trichoderma gracile]